MAEILNTNIPDMVTVGGVTYENLGFTHYAAQCRMCGDLPSVARPQSAEQAGLVQRRHLAEHLLALGGELTRATR